MINYTVEYYAAVFKSLLIWKHLQDKSTGRCMTSFTVHEKPTHAYVSAHIENHLEGYTRTRSSGDFMVEKKKKKSSGDGGEGRFFTFYFISFWMDEGLMYAGIIFS